MVSDMVINTAEEKVEQDISGEHSEFCDCEKIRNQIFERAVEDGLFSGLESEQEQQEQEEEVATARNNEKERGNNYTYSSRIREEELDPLMERAELEETCEGSEGMATSSSSTVIPLKCVGCEDKRNSCECSCACCPNCHKFKRARSNSGVSFDLDSRQASRNRSISSFGGTAFRPESSSGSRAGSIVVPLSKQSTHASLGSCQDESTLSGACSQDGSGGSPRTGCGSRSSICLSTNCIPTHLFSLERFVSSELDSATESFFNETKRLSDSTTPSDSIASSLSNLSLKNSIPNTETSSVTSSVTPSSPRLMGSKNCPPFLDLRKRRKSFIEMSLAESLP